MNLVRSRMAFAYSQIYQIACFGDFMAYVGIVFCAALQLHPDKNKHPKAEIAFKLVSEVRINFALFQIPPFEILILGTR